MNIINKKCPNCQSNLKVSQEDEMVICEYCGTSFLVQNENETKTEKIIKRFGKELKKSRDYYSSDSYKERIRIKNEEKIKKIKTSVIILSIIFIPTIFFCIFFTPKLNMTCTLNDKVYVISIEENNISCVSCDDVFLKELNEKYLNKNDVFLTKENIIAYFNNNSGKCNDE